MAEGEVFVHPDGRCDSERVGGGTRVWGGAHVMAGAVVGRNCNLAHGVFVEQGAVIGDNVTVKNGVSIWEGVTVEDYVFLGPHCILTNDIRPRSKMNFTSIPTRIRFGATIGAGAIIICGNDIGRFALVGAGAVVTRPVADHALVVGRPGRLTGWVCVCGESITCDNSSKCICDRCGREFELRGDRPVLAGELVSPFSWIPRGQQPDAD